MVSASAPWPVLIKKATSRPSALVATSLKVAAKPDPPWGTNFEEAAASRPSASRMAGSTASGILGCVQTVRKRMVKK